MLALSRGARPRYAFGRRATVLRSIVFVLVFIIGAGAARVLACELTCAAAANAARPHAPSCHESHDPQAKLSAASDDLCVTDVTPPAIAAQKSHPVKAAPTCSSNGVRVDYISGASYALNPPRQPDQRSHNPIASVLRI